MLNQDQKQQPNEQMVKRLAEIISDYDPCNECEKPHNCDHCPKLEPLGKAKAYLEKLSLNIQPLDEGELLEIIVPELCGNISCSKYGKCLNVVNPEDCITLRFAYRLSDKLRRYAQGKDKEIEVLRAEKAQKQLCIDDLKRQLIEEHKSVEEKDKEIELLKSSIQVKENEIQHQIKRVEEAVKKEREGNVIIPRSVWDLIVDYLPSSPPFEQLIKDEALKKGE